MEVAEPQTVEHLKRVKPKLQMEDALVELHQGDTYQQLNEIRALHACSVSEALGMIAVTWTKKNL